LVCFGNFIFYHAASSPVVFLVLAVAFSPQPAAAALEPARLGAPLRHICASKVLLVRVRFGGFKVKVRVRVRVTVRIRKRFWFKIRLRVRFRVGISIRVNQGWDIAARS